MSAAAHNSGVGAAEYIRENVRKLSLFQTRTFGPLSTHDDDLDPLLSRLGFLGQTPRHFSGVLCKEYVFSGPNGPKPRLPYPRIDGLHMVTYAVFVEAVNFYLRLYNVADLFHVRGMPLHKVYDRNERWKRMEDDEFCVFLYRHGTLDRKVHSFSLRNFQNDVLDVDNEGYDAMLIHKHKTSTPTGQIVPLKDILV